MRLRDLKHKIEENIQYLSVKGVNTNNAIRVSEYQDAVDAMVELSNLNFVAEEILEINNKCKEIMFARTPFVDVDGSIYNDFSLLLNLVKVKCESALAAINEALPEQNEFSISVKLPPIKNLSELTDYIHTLDIALSGAIIRDDLKGKVELQNLDTGTNWVEIILGTSMAFGFVGKIIWAALGISKKMHENEFVKQTVRFTKINADAMQAVEEGLAATIKDLCQHHANELINQGDTLVSDGEYSNRLSASIEMLSGIMFKGAEIYQSTISQTQYKDVFPSVTEFKLLNSAVKLLTGTSTEENESST